MLVCVIMVMVNLLDMLILSIVLRSEIHVPRSRRLPIFDFFFFFDKLLAEFDEIIP